MSRPRKVHVKSFGCQMNVYDSHRMADTLAPAGFRETASPEDADLVILNTCNIREKAAEKVYSEIGRIRVMKEEAGAPRPPHADRGGRLRGASRGRRDRPPRRLRRSGGRLAELSPPARPARARAKAARKSSIPNFRPRTSSNCWRRLGAKQSVRAAFPPSSPCRKAATSSARFASCPIRAVRKCRARSRRSSPRSSGWRLPACAR